MPVVVNLQSLGTYKKLRNRTADFDAQPSLLNERRRYGKLREQQFMDLTKGSDKFKDEGFGDCLFSFFDYTKKTNPPGTPLKQAIGSDFVSNRRNLINFAESPYPSARKFEVRAIRKDGVIFLCDTESRSVQSNDWSYGFKFEKYMTLNEHGVPHDDDEPASNAECVKAVLRTTFESEGKEMKVFYAAELDAIDKSGDTVEFKTTHLGYLKWVQRRSLRDYLQSYLGGISYIVKGFTKDHVVIKMDKIFVDDIPYIEGVQWNRETCFERLFEILEEIKTRLQNDDEAIIIRNDGKNIHYESEDASKCDFVDPEFLRYFH